LNGVIVLAGGRSLRIGRDKCFMMLEGEPLIKHVVTKIRLFFEEVIVVSNRNSDTSPYTLILPSSVDVIKDVFASEGPLVGIVSGMKRLKSNYVATAPCDSPFVEIEVYKFLFQRVRGFDAAIPKWPNGYIEPLHSVYRRTSAIRAGEEALREGELSILDMIKRLKNIVAVSTTEIERFDPQLLTFLNINTIKDFEKAKKVMRSQRIRNA